MRFQIFFISAILSIASIHVFAQDRCATVEYEAIRHQKNPALENSQQFENWLKNKIAQPKLKQQGTQRTQSATYTIPVVVHIIHNGEAIGTGANLSDAQIISQINVMNKDFARLNLDAVNTPSEFLPVAGNLDIEFVLAKQDPFGAATTGITRTKGTQSSWKISDNATFKGLSYWPAENYFNIWVLNLPDYLGYAQLPVSTLDGLENSPDDRLTDGIIIHYKAFGSNFEGLGTFNLETKYNRGRTATHETGHFLGLRHIWGDSNCGTDYVADTPTQQSKTSTCPAHPQTTNCGGAIVKMFQNYMDYTDDACMNLFTQGQNGRMIVVLENSPRRVSLLNSLGATAPPPLALDIALRKINSPGTTSCGGLITPTLEIQNLGTTAATLARIQLKTNGAITETKDFVMNLPFEEITNVSFQSVVQPAGTTLYEFEVLLVNAGADQRASNNKLAVSSLVQQAGAIPVSEVFNSFPANWSVYNPDNSATWDLITTPSNGKSMYVNCYDYQNEGAVDRLITPVFDLTSATVAFLKFDYAHAIYGSNNVERLRVLVSTVCDFNSPAVVIFDSAGSSLATAPQTTSRFTPTASQWRTAAKSLNNFIGNKIQIAFEVTNGWGNNVYVDNIVVSTESMTDIAISSIESPGPVTCVTNPAPVIRVKNLGSVNVTSFSIQAFINGQAQPIQILSNIMLGASEENTFTINTLPLLTGDNTITITISEPNGLPEEILDNNSISIKRVVNPATDRIPLREDFNGSFSTWSIISQNNEDVWTPIGTNKSFSPAYLAFDNLNLGEESWLVSPVLDFSKTSKASLFFDVSYANQSHGNEQLRILYSEDCGQTYSNILYDQSGSALSSSTSDLTWIPNKDADWRREFINLNSLTGKEQLRFAFVAKANHGNNLYLDNIEFFIDDNPFPVPIQQSYSVYGTGNEMKLTFNLTEKQTAFLKIYDIQGKVLVDNILPDVLNQTYSFDLGIQGSGIYIVRVVLKDQVSATKVFLGGK